MKLRVNVEGKTYEVEVEVAEPEAPVATQVARTPRASGGGAAPKKSSGAPVSNVADDKACKSPLAGVVSSVEVKPGDEVKADQPLLVLEAMKMLTTVTCPRDAKVKDVPVAVGDSVKQGQLLVEFE